MTEITYRGSDDCPLYATTLGRTSKPASAGEERVLVLLHGGGPDHDSLVPLARQLADLAAAAAIGHDRAFRSIDYLAVMDAPTLIIPGTGPRHPTALAEDLARILPRGQLASLTLSADLQTADDFARAFAPLIRDFLITTLRMVKP